MNYPQTYIDFDEAIEDGRLVAANEELASQAGYRVPVAFSRECHKQFVQWSSGDPCQDEVGRAWDVLTMAGHALIKGRDNFDIAIFQILCVPPNQDLPVLSQLKVAWLGTEEWDDPCVVIMLPSESTRALHGSRLACK